MASVGCFRWFGGFVACVSLSGCASYHSAPLILTSPLQPSTFALVRKLPDGRTITGRGPFSLEDVAALAIVNDPDLIAARAQHGVGEADLLSAGLLPDPSITGGFAALISGPASVPSISGGLAEDLSALITYRANVQGAKAGLAQIDATIFWQEWQVASQAEQLCINLDGDKRIVATLQSDHDALTGINNASEAQVAANNLTLNASSASMAALAATDTALNVAIQAQNQDLDQLDSLLGLQPGIAVPVTLPVIQPLDPHIAAKALATLTERRPDLIALRYGYIQADAKLRAAILTQFLPINIGATGGRDTTDVWSAGPQVTLTLPLFNRNRGGIATATATRAQLASQFTASLASANAGAEALIARIVVLEAESHAADRAAADAVKIASQAETAQTNGSLDALSAVNLRTAAADRQREAIALDTQLLTARLSLNTMLAIGLPPIAGPAMESTP
jgi:outer membrane protein TolC